MKNLIFMAKDKASRLSDEELANEIGQFASGGNKLRLRDERNRLVDLTPLILSVFKREQDERQKKESIRKPERSNERAKKKEAC